MDLRSSTTLLGLATLSTILLSIPAGAADWTYSYCSSLNTGDQSTSYTWPYQSNGNCTNHCKQDGGPWAFAVIQYTNCWCSNYVPGTTADSSGCLVDCPGFPDEKCGNKDKGLYIYVQMDGQPSGTQGGSSSTAAPASSSQNSPPSSSPPPPPPSSPSPKPTSAPPPPQVVTSILTQNPETIEKTVTVQPAPSSSPPSTSTTKKPSTNDSPAATEQPVTVPTLVTESGMVITRTVVITPIPAASTGQDSNKSSTDVGAIAGGVAGGVVGLLAIVGVILFLLMRRRRQREQNGQEGGAGITRNVSTMSRAGLLGGQAEKTTPLTTTFGSQRSRHDDDSITPVTPSTRRLSQPILVDSRLNPAAVLTFHGNQSRESLGSIDDSRDYGRQLNVRNPDP